MERNVTLDFVRGVAILGILLLNISAFGLPKAAYLNPAWSGSASLSDAWTWALLDLLAQVKFLTLFALLFGAGLQLLLPRGKRWIQSRLTLLALLGFIHGLFFWDGDILLAYALVGLVSWRMVREAHHVKSLFNTGVVLYLTGIAVLVLLGMISGPAANRSWVPDAANLQYEQYWKLHGGMEAVSNRADMLSDNLLALGAQYGWQLAGMMLIGAALMRSGWLKGQFSQRHYRRTGVLLVAAVVFTAFIGTLLGAAAQVVCACMARAGRRAGWNLVGAAAACGAVVMALTVLTFAAINTASPNLAAVGGLFALDAAVNVAMLLVAARFTK